MSTGAGANFGCRRFGRALTVSWLAASLSAQGCFGFAAVARGSNNLALHRPLLRPADAAPADGAPAQRAVSGEELRRAWGEPWRQRVGTTGETEWVYRCGLRWNGLGLLLLVVPVPLLVPTGFRQARVELRDDKVFAVHADVAATTARAGCLWGPLADDGPACRVSGRPESVGEVRCGGDAAFVADDRTPAPAP